MLAKEPGFHSRFFIHFSGCSFALTQMLTDHHCSRVSDNVCYKTLDSVNFLISKMILKFD